MRDAVCMHAWRADRIVCAAGLAVISLLVCIGLGQSALADRAPSASFQDAARQTLALGSEGEDETPLAIPRDARRVRSGVVGAQWHVRARSTDANTVTMLPDALAGSRADLLGFATHAAREHLAHQVGRHLPTGTPSPYDATAPPSRSSRDG